MRGGDEHGSGNIGIDTGRHSTHSQRPAQTVGVRIEYTAGKHEAKHSSLFE